MTKDSEMNATKHVVQSRGSSGEVLHSICETLVYRGSVHLWRQLVSGERSACLQQSGLGRNSGDLRGEEKERVMATEVVEDS